MWLNWVRGERGGIAGESDVGRRSWVAGLEVGWRSLGSPGGVAVVFASISSSFVSADDGGSEGSLQTINVAPVSLGDHRVLNPTTSNSTSSFSLFLITNYSCTQLMRSEPRTTKKRCLTCAKCGFFNNALKLLPSLLVCDEVEKAVKKPQSDMRAWVTGSETCIVIEMVRQISARFLQILSQLTKKNISTCYEFIRLSPQKWCSCAQCWELHQTSAAGSAGQLKNKYTLRSVPRREKGIPHPRTCQRRQALSEHSQISNTCHRRAWVIIYYSLDNLDITLPTWQMMQSFIRFCSYSHSSSLVGWKKERK